MPKLGYYEQGSHNAQCDECGRWFKFENMRLRWDLAWVCDTGTCWEPRQPQDFQKGVKDDPSVPIARPRIVSTGLSTLASSITASAVSLTVVTGQGILFPEVITGKMLMTLQSVNDPTRVEFIYCRAHSAASDTFTSLLRGQLGSVALAFDAADTVTEIEYTP